MKPTIINLYANGDEQRGFIQPLKKYFAWIRTMLPIFHAFTKWKGIRLFICCLMLLLTNSQTVLAQLKLPGAAYFQNQYLANPALAGMREELTLNASYSKLFNDIPGSPVTQILTADYGFSPTMGAGLTVVNDKAGILKRTKVMGSYAYHIAFNPEHKLHVGFSLGAMMERLDHGALIGDPNDPSLSHFTTRENYFDADFGLAYTYNDKLTIQGSIPNLVSQYRKYDVEMIDKPSFFTAVSYKTKLEVNGAEPIGIEPKVCFRGIKGYDNIIDLGANLSFLQNQLLVSTMYHTTNSFSFGIGFEFKFKMAALVMYDTKSADLKGVNTGDSFDLALRFSL